MIHVGLLSLLVLQAIAVHAMRDYTITNNCPGASTLYINGASQGTLAANGGSTQQSMNNTFEGLIYLDVNGGNQDGSGTTRAGFYGTNDYYYVVVDPNHMNVGVSITPLDRGAPSGFCVTDTCTDPTCSAYQQPPTSFPAPTTSVPSKPLYSCHPVAYAGYNITFCPSGSYPPPIGQAIHPNSNSNKCLDVRGAVFANGTPVQIYDCNGTNAQKWLIYRGNTKVQVAGTNFCLDAGSSPASGVGMKIWQCYDNLPAQAWYYTTDNRIAVTGQGQCLDLSNGVLVNSNQVQTWACTNNDVNQIWT